MAGGSSRPTTTFTSNTPSHSSSSSHHHHTFTSRILFLVTLLPLSLAAFAFLLQWRGGGLTLDPISRHYSTDHHRNNLLRFPGMEVAATTTTAVSASANADSGCDHLLGRIHSLPSFPYFRDWKFHFGKDLKPKVSYTYVGICITTSTSAGLEQVLPWILYHKVIGVSTFFLFVEGRAAAPNVSQVLKMIPGVSIIHRTKELEEQQAKSRIWNETWLASFFYKPCNYELFVKQSLNMEMAIVKAREAGMDWIFHLDTDELIHPVGAREYSLSQLLLEVPQNVDMVIFSNYESSVERADIKEPFGEVSMFKKNYDHLPKDVYFGNYKEATRGNPNYFLTYGNGKSAARVQDHLRPNGAHRWYNYKKAPKEITLDEAAVLHYTYTKFSDLTSRRDRCGCKPTKEDVKRCFMLEFDRAAFIIASTATEEEMLHWYQEHVVWTDEKLKLKLLKKGILTRIHAPMVIVQGLRESGIFRTIIASAQASVENNSSSAAHSGQVYSRKIGHATERMILQIAENASFPSAIPPLSPPGLEHMHFNVETQLHHF